MASKRMNGQFYICFDDSKDLLSGQRLLTFCNWKLHECHVKRSATVRSQSFASSMDKMGNMAIYRAKSSKAIHISIAMRHSKSNRSERIGQSIGWWQKKMLLFQKVECTFAKRMLNNYRLDVVVLKNETKYTTKEMAVKWWQTSTGT